jgi:hypothetical protein
VLERWPEGFVRKVDKFGVSDGGCLTPMVVIRWG